MFPKILRNKSVNTRSWPSMPAPVKFGAFVDTPKTDKTTSAGVGPSLRYVIGSMQGWRAEMEDTHITQCGLGQHGLEDWCFFAVFDGHAGRQVADYAAKHMLTTLLKCEELKQAVSAKNQAERHDAMHMVFAKTFLTLDMQMRRIPDMESGADRSGATAICALVCPDFIYFSNLGDSRAIAASNGALRVATEDHKPFRSVEQRRIAAAGGKVLMQRINGNLAVSRALGDYEYKNSLDRGPFEQLVSPEPDLYPLQRTDEDEFMVLACDGVWDVISNEELYGYVRYQLRLHSDLETICANVIDMCLGRGSKDNITFVLVLFNAAPTVSEEIRAADKLFEAQIEQAVREIMSCCPPPIVMDGSSLTHLVAEVLSDNKVYVPDDSGGAKNKKKLIESIWNSLLPERPLRQDFGELSPATILKVLGNRALAKRLQRPLLGDAGSAVLQPKKSITKRPTEKTKSNSTLARKKSEPMTNYKA